MNVKKTIKTIILLISPLLLFVVLPKPYLYVNSVFIVKWLGCGCPSVDEMGNVIEHSFNANSFTAIFWTVVSLVAAVIAAILSKRLIAKRKPLRVLYVFGILAVSLLISYRLYISMMWN